MVWLYWLLLLAAFSIFIPNDQLPFIPNMSSDLNNGTGPLFVSATPPKIDPAAPPPLFNQEEKKDMVKDEATPASNSASASSGLGKSDTNYFRDVYSSSPEEDDLDMESAEDTDKFIEINISEPHKVGEGMSSFMAYKVTTKTNLKFFKRENFGVTRRFSDFLGKYTTIYTCPIYAQCTKIQKRVKFIEAALSICLKG